MRRWLGQGEDVYAVGGDNHSVLELGGAFAVAGDDGPVVLPHIPFDAAQGEHGFDGEDHAFFDDGVVGGGRIVVGDDEAGVELAAYAVAGEVAHHAVAEAGGVLFDDAADDVDFAAGAYGLHGAVEGFFGAFNEQAGFFVDVADEQGLVGVAVHIVQVGGDVQVEDVAVFEDGGVGDAVADDLVEGGADGLGEAPVVDGGGVGPVVADVFVDEYVNVVGGGAGDRNFLGFDDGSGGDFAGGPHHFYFFGGVEVGALAFVGFGFAHVFGAGDVGWDGAHGGYGAGGEATDGCLAGFCGEVVGGGVCRHGFYGSRPAGVPPTVEGGSGVSEAVSFAGWVWAGGSIRLRGRFCPRAFGELNVLENITPGPHDPEFYYNLKTGAVEEGQQSPIKDLWGPFATREEAARAMETARRRNEELDAEKDGWF